MIALINIDWQSVFVPSTSILEVILRGTLVYLFLFIVLRFLRRSAGAIGISDLLVVVVIADAAQNAMGSKYESVTEGAVLVLTIVGWDYLLDRIAFSFPSLRPILRPKPLLLIKDGKMLPRNMRKEMISEDEMISELREQGVDKVEDVKYSYMESDGHISVVKKSKKD
ncbi:MAG TPA: YetF domain-containing protein [Pyrinomonadaceae bacterium]|nr:YetF domain-containing protein [Pyrinomonadaceae bacterium]